MKIYEKYLLELDSDNKTLPELKFNIVNSKGKRFKLADSKIGNRSKLGGKPDFIQNNETFICKKCHKKMSFYGQLDSINDEYMIGDSGMIYVFYCFDCGETKAISQSY